MLLETRESTKSRLLRLLDAFAKTGPGGFIDGYNATDELTGEKGFGLKVGEAMYVFTLAEGAMIAELLDEISEENPPAARKEGIPCLAAIVREMLKRAKAAAH